MCLCIARDIVCRLKRVESREACCYFWQSGVIMLETDVILRDRSFVPFALAKFFLRR